MTTEKDLLKWYLESGVDEVIEEKPTNHFEIYQKKIEEKKGSKNSPIASNITAQQVQNSSQIPTSSQIVNNAKSSTVEKQQTKNTEQQGTNVQTSYNEIARQAVSKVKNLDDLKKEIEKFEGCSFIKSLAKHTVFSRGNPKGDIMIVGEAPGAEEDAQGIPFCGQSGQLLDNMLRGVGFYDRVYITNTTFWRPPGNRKPTEEELFACRPFVEKHIQLINPKLIIAMGATAMGVILNKESGVTTMRRNFFDYTNSYLDGKKIKATPLFHPSFLLRQPIKKRDAWKDWLIIDEFLNTINK
jgi:DNA polymerase